MSISGWRVGVGVSLLGVAVVAVIEPSAQTTRCRRGVFAAGAAASTFTPPRTPWGDPDLQGNYTNTYEQGTPLERPEQFAGRTLEDVKGEELARAREEIQKRTVGNFQGPIHAPDHWWQDNLFLERGSQAWLVVDPAGREGSSADARGAEPQRRTRGGAQGQRSRPGRFVDGSQPVRPVPDARHAQLDDAVHLRQLARDRPGARRRRDSQRDDPRGAGHPARWPPAHRAGLTQDMGDARGRWEGDTLVVETTNFKERSVYRNANPATLKVTERFVRTSPTQVRWTVTVDDPSTWTRPWTFSLPLTVDDQPMPAYECHEGNYGLRNILSAARAEERDAARTGRPVGASAEGPSNESGAPAEGR